MARVIFMTDFSEKYARSILKGMMQYAHEREPWSVTRIPLSLRDKYGIKEIVEWAKHAKANAVIGQFFDDDPVELFKENGILAIAQDFKSRFTQIPNITGTHELAGQLGAQYFAKKGFKNFAFYGLKDFVWSEERCQGFVSKAKELVPEAVCFEYKNDTPSMLWYYDQQDIISWLLSLPKPVAIMACDDNLAYHISEACQQVASYGCRIPYDIALLGVDDDETICNLPQVKISSVAQSVVQGGYDVAKLIGSFVQDHNAVLNNVVVKADHVVTRGSTDIYANENKYISKIVRYIHERLSDRLSVEDVVAQVPMSRRLLEVKFKEEIGVSIYDYIVNARIDKMSELLLGKMTISEIALELGFFDTKNISRTFKKIKGVTPSEYREINKRRF